MTPTLSRSGVWLAAILCALNLSCKTTSPGGTPSSPESLASVTSDQQALVNVVHSFNRDAWQFSPAAKTLQVSGMKASVAEFYRITPYLFYAVIRQKMSANPTYSAQINSAGSGPIFADLHPLNVAWDQINGAPVAWVNDFDDTTQAPFAAEMLRSLTSVLVFAPQAVASDVGASFLTAYDAARSGKISGGEGQQLAMIVGRNVANAVDATPSEAQPDVSKDVLHAALRALQNAPPGVLQGMQDVGSCKTHYKTYAGGSSEGLPRFRFECGSNTYEIKASRTAAWDAAGAPGVAVDNAKRIVNGARMLASPQAGAFFEATSLFGQSWSGPWSYYGHQRLGNSFNVSGLSANEAKALAFVLGGLAGAGHRRAGAAPLGAATLSALQTFIPNEAAVLAQKMHELWQTLPDCL